MALCIDDNFLVGESWGKTGISSLNHFVTFARAGGVKDERAGHSVQGSSLERTPSPFFNETSTFLVAVSS